MNSDATISDIKIKPGSVISFLNNTYENDKKNNIKSESPMEFMTNPNLFNAYCQNTSYHTIGRQNYQNIHRNRVQELMKRPIDGPASPKKYENKRAKISHISTDPDPNQSENHKIAASEPAKYNLPRAEFTDDSQVETAEKLRQIFSRTLTHHRKIGLLTLGNYGYLIHNKKAAPLVTKIKNFEINLPENYKNVENLERITRTTRNRNNQPIIKTNTKIPISDRIWYINSLLFDKETLSIKMRNNNFKNRYNNIQTAVNLERNQYSIILTQQFQYLVNSNMIDFNYVPDKINQLYHNYITYKIHKYKSTYPNFYRVIGKGSPILIEKSGNYIVPDIRLRHENLIGFSKNCNLVGFSIDNHLSENSMLSKKVPVPSNRDCSNEHYLANKSYLLTDQIFQREVLTNIDENIYSIPGKVNDNLTNQKIEAAFEKFKENLNICINSSTLKSIITTFKQPVPGYNTRAYLNRWLLPIKFNLEKNTIFFDKMLESDPKTAKTAKKINKKIIKTWFRHQMTVNPDTWHNSSSLGVLLDQEFENMADQKIGYSKEQVRNFKPVKNYLYNKVQLGTFKMIVRSSVDYCIINERENSDTKNKVKFGKIKFEENYLPFYDGMFLPNATNPSVSKFNNDYVDAKIFPENSLEVSRAFFDHLHFNLGVACGDENEAPINVKIFDDKNECGTYLSEKYGEKILTDLGLSTEKLLNQAHYIIDQILFEIYKNLHNSNFNPKQDQHFLADFSQKNSITIMKSTDFVYDPKTNKHSQQQKGDEFSLYHHLDNIGNEKVNHVDGRIESCRYFRDFEVGDLPNVSGVVKANKELRDVYVPGLFHDAVENRGKWIKR